MFPKLKIKEKTDTLTVETAYIFLPSVLVPFNRIVSEELLPSQTASNSSALCSPNFFHYHIHKSPHLTCKLCAVNLVRQLPACKLKTCFHTPSTKSILQAACFFNVLLSKPHLYFFYYILRTTAKITFITIIFT